MALCLMSSFSTFSCSPVIGFWRHISASVSLPRSQPVISILPSHEAEQAKIPCLCIGEYLWQHEVVMVRYVNHFNSVTMASECINVVQIQFVDVSQESHLSLGTCDVCGISHSLTLHPRPDIAIFSKVCMTEEWNPLSVS